MEKEKESEQVVVVSNIIMKDDGEDEIDEGEAKYGSGDGEEEELGEGGMKRRKIRRRWSKGAWRCS